MTIEILDGNEIIVQGALEAGFSLYTGYPGSPLADYFNILHKRRHELKAKGIHVVIANSEANAAAMASGAKQAGKDCIVAMKSMGLHVASDALSVGNFANPGGEKLDPETGEILSPGTVIVVGDDPWSMSTSTPADSRYLYKHLHIPFLEPSTPQELKEWIKVALDISKRTSVYQGLLLSTFMAEGGGRVEVGKAAHVDAHKINLDPAEFDLKKNVMVPPNSLFADVAMINERFPKVQKVLEEFKLDQIFGNKESKVGFITSGVIFETIKHVLEEGDYLSEFSLYKVACSYPLVDNFLVPYLRGLDSLIVVEEKRGFLENELSSLCQRHGIKIRIYGKKFNDEQGFPAHGGLSFEIIKDKLSSLFKIMGLSPCDMKSSHLSPDGDLPKRLPTFCPGCPHRETLSLLKDLRQVLKDEDKMNLISHGDVGCYSLSFLEPFKEMHNLSAMGQGGALGAGVDMFTENPSVVLMGDSTFFHSGLTDISNSVQNGHNITYILLDNDNTAMTGHQMTPASGISVDGGSRPRQSMLGVAKSLGVDTAVEVHPSDRYFYKNLLKDFVKRPGVKVIVSNKECALTFHGKRKAVERSKFSAGDTLKTQKFYQINTDACEDCRACVEMTGCPGLTQVFDAYGSKVAIDPQICVSDSYCTKIKACPSFELVEVANYHPSKFKTSVEKNEKLDIPLPKVLKSFDDIAQGSDLRIVVTGVGGSGVTTISRVIAEAAKSMGGRDDLDFKFMDQKGLAQRNGNVTGHLLIYKKELSRGAVIPVGTADLVLSPDLLDGAGKVNFLSESGTAIFDKKSQIPLSILLDNGEGARPLTDSEIQLRLKEKFSKSTSSSLILRSMKELSDLTLGKSVYASAMILGVAFQSGKLPFSLGDMVSAFKKVTRKEELENNLYAFSLGRRVFSDEDETLYASLSKTKLTTRRLELYRESLSDSFLFSQNKQRVLRKYDETFNKLKDMLSFIEEEHLANYLHDIFIYDRGAKVKEFLKDVNQLKGLLTDREHLRVALRSLVKTYWVKDEVMIAHLMISPLRKDVDDQTYLELGESYTKSFINRPSFNVIGRVIEFDISPKQWMLKSMRHLRILRTLLPAWHSKERSIAKKIRRELLIEIVKLNKSSKYSRLKEIENIKGYRDIRYANAARVIN